MAPPTFRFDRFVLETHERRLMRDGTPVELSGRYFDALSLLVGEHGRLVSKNRLLEEVWRGVPVTDEALTQCVRTLRKHLGDDAARPRFIETVPKHGYRFIAAVDQSQDAPGPAPAPRHPSRQFLLLATAGAIGGGGAGMLGGLLYSVISALQPLPSGTGAASFILVLVCVTLLVGVLGGAGVALGIAATGLPSGRLGRRSIFAGPSEVSSSVL